MWFDEKVARPPQSLSLFKNKQDDKEPLTLDKIEEKQELMLTEEDRY